MVRLRDLALVVVVLLVLGCGTTTTKEREFNRTKRQEPAAFKSRVKWTGLDWTRSGIGHQLVVGWSLCKAHTNTLRSNPLTG